jgi:hypothetical protein
MGDQAALAGDELQLFLGVPVEECLIDLPAIAQVDLEGLREVGDVAERDHVLRVGGADDGEHDLRLPVGQAPDRRDLGAIVEVGEGRADQEAGTRRQGVGLDLRQRARHGRDEDRDLRVAGVARERAGERGAPDRLAKVGGAARDRFRGDGWLLRRCRAAGRSCRNRRNGCTRTGRFVSRWQGIVRIVSMIDVGLVDGAILLVIVGRVDGGGCCGPCCLRGAFLFLEADRLGGFVLELEACGIGAAPVVDMGLEEDALRSRVERAGGAFGLVETGGREVLRDAHEQLARLGHIEAGLQDRVEGLVLLVPGDGGEQLGMADLDPAFIERELGGVAEFGERQPAIELGPGPAESPGGFGAVARHAAR